MNDMLCSVLFLLLCAEAVRCHQKIETISSGYNDEKIDSHVERSVSISSEGDHVAVGTFRKGTSVIRVDIFQFMAMSSSWVQHGHIDVDTPIAESGVVALSHSPDGFSVLIEGTDSYGLEFSRVFAFDPSFSHWREIVEHGGNAFGDKDNMYTASLSEGGGRMTIVSLNTEVGIGLGLTKEFIFDSESYTWVQLRSSSGIMKSSMPVHSAPPRLLAASDSTSSASNTEPPRMSSCRFSNDGSFFEVQFDIATDRGGLGRVHGCSELFEFFSVHSALCVWREGAVQVFPTGMGEGGPEKLVVEGDSVVMKGDSVRAKCFSFSNSTECSLWPTSPSHTCSLSAPLFPVQPVVAITAPALLGQCHPYMLDLSSSQGAGGRPWSNFTVSMSTKSGTGYSLINSETILRFFALNYTFSPPVALPAGLFIGNEHYYITIELCNFLGHCANSTTVLQTVTSKHLPWVTIAGDPTRSIRRSETLLLQTSAYVYTCIGDAWDTWETRTSGMSYEWVVQENGTTSEGVVSGSKDPARFILRGSQLLVGCVYRVTVAVRDEATQFGEESPAAVTVTVLSSALVAVIAGGEERAWRNGSVLILDGSSSYDPDGDSDEEDDSEGRELSFQWSCEQNSSALPSSFCSQLLQEPLSSSTLSLHPLNLLEDNGAALGAKFTISLNVSGSHGRSAVSTVKVTLVASSAPVLLLSSAPEQVTHQQAVKVQATAEVSSLASAVWSVADDSVDLSVASTVSLSTLLSGPGTFPLNLALTTNSLLPGLAYEFLLSLYPSTPTLADSDTVMSVTVVVVEPPRAGQLRVDPSFGEEWQQLFSFSTSLWVGEDLPLSFAFSFGHSPLTSTTGAGMLQLQARSESSRLRKPSFLPRGRVSRDYNLTCSVYAYNALDAVSGADQEVNVEPGLENTAQQELERVQEQLQLVHLSAFVDEVRAVVSVGVTALNTPNCSSDSIAHSLCSALAREDCFFSGNSHLPCGPCLPGFEAREGGELGGGSQCYSSSDLLIATASALGEVPAACVNTSQCTVTQTCSEGLCREDEKSCSLNCTGHGQCQTRLLLWPVFLGTSPPEEVRPCLLGDPSCEKKCVCDEEYGGPECSLSLAVLEARELTRQELVLAANSSLQREDISDDSLVALSATMHDLAAVSSELTVTSCTMLQYMTRFALEGISASSGGLNHLPTSSLEVFWAVLDQCDSVFISFETDSSSFLIALSDDLRQKYLRLVGDSLVMGEKVREVDGSHSRASVSLSPLTHRLKLLAPRSPLEKFFGQHESVLHMAPRGEGSDGLSRLVLLTESDHRLRVNGSLFSCYPLRIEVFHLAEGINHTNSGSDNESFVVVLQSVVSQQYVTSQPPSLWLFRTECSPLNHSSSANAATFTCPDGRVITHRCEGRYETIVTECPQYRFLPSCRVLSGNTSSPRPPACDVLSFTSDNVTCNCSLPLSHSSGPFSGRRLSSSASSLASGAVEVVSVSFEAFEFELSTNILVHDVASREVAPSMLVLVVVAVLWCCGLLGVLEMVKDRYICVHKVEPVMRGGGEQLDDGKDTERHIAARSTTSLDSAAQTQLVFRYFYNLLPEVFREDESFWTSALTALRRHHRYASPVTRGEAAKDLSLHKGFHLLTILAMLMFLTAAFFNIQFPEDEAHCAVHLEEAICEQELSVWDSSLSRCEWLAGDPAGAGGGHGYCAFSPAQLTVQVVIVLLMLSTATAPFGMCIDFLFDEVLAAPQAEEFVANMPLLSPRHSPSPDEKRPRWVRQSVSLANTATVPLFAQLPPSQVSMEWRRQHPLFGALRDWLRVSGASVTLVPPSIVAHRAAVADAVSGLLTFSASGNYPVSSSVAATVPGSPSSPVFSSRKNCRVDSAPDDIEEEAVPFDFSSGGDADADAVERGQVSPVLRFMHQLGRQHAGLGVAARVDLQERWGFVPLSMAVPLGLTPSAEVLPLPSPGPRISFMDRHCYKDRGGGVSPRVERALVEKHAACVCLESVHRGLVSPPGSSELLRGMEVVHLFMADLLGRDTAEGRIFVAMTGEDFKKTSVVTGVTKVLAWGVVFVLNAFFVLSILLMGMSRSRDWQNIFLCASLVLLLLEAAFYRTLQCLWTHIAVPKLISADVYATMATVHQTISVAFQKSGQGGDEGVGLYFNSAEHFFVSRALAERFSRVMESSVVLAFRSFFPPPSLDLLSQPRIGKGNSWLARLVTGCSVRAVGLRMMLLSGASPLPLQKVLVHTLVPVMLAALLLLAVNPLWLALPAALLLWDLLLLAIERGWYRDQEKPLAAINDADLNLASLEGFEIETRARRERAERERKERLIREKIERQTREREEQEQRLREEQEAVERAERESREKRERRRQKVEEKRVRLQEEQEEHERQVAASEEARLREVRESHERAVLEEQQGAARGRLEREREAESRRVKQEEREKVAREAREARAQAAREEQQRAKEMEEQRESHRKEVERILERRAGEQVRGAVLAHSRTENNSDDKPASLMKMLQVQLIRTNSQKQQGRLRSQTEGSASSTMTPSPSSWEVFARGTQEAMEKENSARREKEKKEKEEQEEKEV